MKIYSYVIPRDYGFAPNPYFGYCTLATCKPTIRRCAQVGDWVAAFGAAGTSIHGKLVMLMRVGEILTFDEYWADVRFQCKHPVFNRAVINMYGDNIYHHVDGEWMQELSHHSEPDGNINYTNLNRDTNVDRVLIAEKFFYFGNNAIVIPAEFAELIGRGRNHKVCYDEVMIENFVYYIHSNFGEGIHGVPYSRKPGKFAHYKGEK